MSAVRSALQHIRKELMLPEIGASLEFDFEKTRKAHDSIHEFMLLAPRLVPRKPTTNQSFHAYSAYLVYHWEIFDLAHRSSLDALSTFYSAAFILLRATIELILKGSFFECVSHQKFREKATILKRDDKGAELLRFITDLIARMPRIADELETISASIYDKIAPIALDPNYMPSTRKMLEQLVDWGMFDGVPDALDLVYGMYGKLSPNVHVLPDYTDIGRVLLSEGMPFDKRKVIPQHLSEYLEMLHTTVDIAMVVTLNVLAENVRGSQEVKRNLATIVSDARFISLGLQYTPKRISDMLGQNSYEKNLGSSFSHQDGKNLCHSNG